MAGGVSPLVLDGCGGNGVDLRTKRHKNWTDSSFRSPRLTGVLLAGIHIGVELWTPANNMPG